MSIAYRDNEIDEAPTMEAHITEATVLSYPGGRGTAPEVADNRAVTLIDRDAVRAFIDLMIASALALVTLPILLVMTLLSACSFRAAPFFHQDRLGQGGSRFRFTKIRSLPPQAPAAADKYTIAEVRNTRIGAFLRKSKFDELPQLWLVIWGRMSLVGPRPEMPELAATFDPEFVADRLAVRPGVTGLWQVSEGCKGLIGEAPEYDLWYIENRTLRLDLWIVWRTLRLVLPGGEPITLADIPSWCTSSSRSVDLAAA